MSDKGKTILILGNGFDLAHDLPTTYSHFLKFCKEIDKSLLRFNIIKTIMITSNSGKSYDISVTSENLSELSNLLKNNIWYLYLIDLYNKNHMKGENWIDFEFEIRAIIKAVDENSVSLTMHWKDMKNSNTIGQSEFQKLSKFEETCSIREITSPSNVINCNWNFFNKRQI